jgi:hypothetical protein
MVHKVHSSAGGVWWGKRCGCHQIKIPILHNGFHSMVVTRWFSHNARLSSSPCQAAGGVWWGKQNGCHTMVQIKLSSLNIVFFEKWVKHNDCQQINIPFFFAAWMSHNACQTMLYTAF